MKKKDKNIEKQEGTFAIVASMLVLFSAMLNPIVSVIISIFLMISFSIYKLTRR